MRNKGILSMLASSVGKPIRTNGFTSSNENVAYDRYPTEVYAGNEFKKEVRIRGPKECPSCRVPISLVTKDANNKPDPASVASSDEISRLCKEGKFRVAMFIFREVSQSGVNLNRSATLLTLH
ncbi:hypothetical protein QQ045_029336 [Rhodiola kirilowii]